MAAWGSWEQDRQWAKSNWNKYITDNDQKIHWHLEVMNEGEGNFMGEVVIRGNLEGDLTLALAREDE